MNVDWLPGRGIPYGSRERAKDIPAVAGIYATVHHATRGVRIGEGQNIRARFTSHIRWHVQMADGTAREIDLRRLRMLDPDGYLVATAKHGLEGFEFYIVSVDERLRDKPFRQDLERQMFVWLRGRAEHVDWNRQRSWR